MSTILIYDYDFHHYSHIMPNLECAKLAAYEKKNHNIVTFTNNFQPNMYTKVYFRKDYDDGIFNNILSSNIIYGGKAFSQEYKKFNDEVEYIQPDFSIYENFLNSYGNNKQDLKQIKTILRATHIRLSIDNKNLIAIPYDTIASNHPMLIFHDYNIVNIPNSLELLKEICNTKIRNNFISIGNKFPVLIENYNTLIKWLKLRSINGCFYLQYNGVLKDEELIELVRYYSKGLEHFVYNFTYNCKNELYFVQNVLPTIFKQTLFLRRNQLKFLLNIDTSFFQTKEVLNIVKLIKSFYERNNIEKIQTFRTTLYNYCLWKSKMEPNENSKIFSIISIKEMREAFQYIRTYNYNLFDMFYSMPTVIEKGGQLVNEWN